MTKSEFKDWFVAQFGKRPGGRVTDRQLWAELKTGEEADALLTQRDDYDDQWDAALKGWIAGMDRQNQMFEKKKKK